MSEAARVREVWRYFPTAIQTALNVFESQDVPNEPFVASQHAPSLIDASLTCFAQLCALRLNADNVYISLLDGQRQYVLAEATSTSLLRRQERDSRLADQGIWLGATCLPVGRLVSSYLWNTSLLHDPAVDHILVDDLLEIEPYRDGSIAQESPPKRAYAAVPLRSKRGFTIGILCAYYKEARTRESGPVDFSLMQDIAVSVMENLELRRAQEDSQRVENMTRGLIRFIDSTASPSLAQDFADPSPTIQDAQNSPQQSRKSSSQLSPGSLGNSAREEAVFFRPGTRSSGHHTSSSSPSDAKHEQFFGTHKDRRTSSSQNLPETSQAKTTATMKNLLPMQGEAMFTRAAQIIRETSDLDGVVLFDASIAALNQPRVAQALTANEQAFGRSTADFETHRSAKSFSFRDDESATSDTSGSQNSESKARQTCRILGYSGSPSSISTMQADCLTLPEIALRRMLRTYPGGKVINYSSDGQPSSEDSDSTGEGRHLSSASAKKRGEKQLITLKAIHAVAAGATSVAFVPLWDYQRSRYFACCLCWTTRIGRILSPRLDLIFYRAFGNSIMTELSRLDAQTSDAAKTTFVASISHELRSPLHGIMGAAEFLADTDLDSFQVNMLHTITTSGRTLLDTLNHVMDYSKMNQHFDGRPRSTLELKDIGHIRLTATRRVRGNTYSYLNDCTTAADLAVLAEEVVEAVYASQSYRLVASGIEDNDMSHIKASAQKATSVVFSDNGLQTGADISEVLSPEADLGIPTIPDSSTFEADLGRKVVRVILDIEQHQDWSFAIASGVARRVIMNILGNALKFTKSGHVKVSMTANRKLPGLNAKDTQVTLTVSDTGRGMSNDFLVNRLFSAFQQEDSFSSGIGLGMHIVRQLVETVGGRIEIRSRPKQGTEIQVKFNLSRGSEAKLLDDINEVPPAKDVLIGKKVFILDVALAVLANSSSEDSEADVAHKRTAAKLVTDTLTRTLRDWLQMDVTSGESWTNQDVDFVICTEASFYQLREITKKVDGRKTTPIVLFVAVDALEAAALRNDVRIQSDEFVCATCVQPLGPLKMTDVLTQCWQRREDQSQNKQTAESVTSSSPVSAGASRSVTSEPAFAPPPKRPNLTRAQSRQSVHRVDDETDLPIRGGSTTDPTSSHAGPTSSQPRASSPSPPISSTIADPSQRTVLITDDNAINRRLLIAFMKRHKIPYVEAVNGLIALNLYKATPSKFHIILMDLSMPVMDGMTATRRIRSFEREMGLPKVPIIALTGLTSEATRKEAYDSGFDNYLTKPVNFGNLLGWIKMDSASQVSHSAGGSSAQDTPLGTPRVEDVTDIATPTP